VLDVTAVALGLKGKDIPGIDGTELVAQMQFFEQDFLNMKRESKMNLEEVKKIIRDNNYKPTDLFDFKKIIGKIKLEDDQIVYDSDESDPVISNIIEKYVVKQINPVLAEKKEKISKYEPLISEYKELKRQDEIKKARNQIDQVIKDRSLTEGHKKFLDSVFDEYNPELQKLDEFLDNKLAIYKKLVDSGLIQSNENSSTPVQKPSNNEKESKSFEEILEEVQND